MCWYPYHPCTDADKRIASRCIEKLEQRFGHGAPFSEREVKKVLTEEDQDSYWRVFLLF